MKHAWGALILAGLVAASASAAASVAPGGFIPGRSIHRLSLSDPLADHVNYLLSVPASYSQDADSSWPLIIMLHGSEQRGDDPSVLNDMTVLTYADEMDDFSFIIVIPQCPANTIWEPSMVKSVLDSVEGGLRVDRDRVYLTGFSMGGYGAWQTAAKFPLTFAAIAPIGGLADIAYTTRLKGTPIWVFHGAHDVNVPVTESLRMISALRASGIEARLTVYPDLAHDCWTITYGDSRLYLWFLQHSLSGRVTQTRWAGLSRRED
jgi:predicted peptidase